MSAGRIALASSVMALSLLVRPAVVEAAPPTVVPSPGYDLRLQESRRARAAEHYAPSYYGAPVQVAPRATRTPDRWKSRPRRLY